MSQERPVVVGVDGSESALRAVRWAAAEATSRRAPLRLVHGFLWPAGPHADPGLTDDLHKAMTRQAHEWLMQAAEAARQTAPEIEITQELRTVAPTTSLVRESERAALVVLGSRGLGGVTGLLVGSVAVGVTARAHCPVVVIRAEPPVEPDASSAVVVGVDGSPVSETALAFAYGFAARYGSPLVAAHAWLDGAVDPGFGPQPDRETLEQVEREVLAERLAGWAERYPEVTVHRVVSRDRPARALLREAHGARLLVVGCRGRGSLAGLLLGSTSHALLHQAECPLAVVPRPDPPDESG